MNPVPAIILCLFAPSPSFWSPMTQEAVPQVESIEVVTALETGASETDVDRRVREILDEANSRYWRNRARTRTLPEDRWTPQQAGWVDASGRPLVANWPWWAW